MRKADGNHEGLYMSGYDQLDPNITALYDIPSFLPNSDGKLRADKPYQFKLFTRLLVRLGPDVSEGLQRLGGRADLGAGTRNRQRLRRRHDLPAAARISRAARRPTGTSTSTRTTGCPLGSARNLSLILDVFNLFNNHELLEVDQDYVYEGMPGFSNTWGASSNLDEFGNPQFNSNLPSSTFYGTPILYQTRARCRLG